MMRRIGMAASRNFPERRAGSACSFFLAANETVSPAAQVKGGAIYGMPTLQSCKSNIVIVNQRSMASGCGGRDNELF